MKSCALTEASQALVSWVCVEVSGCCGITKVVLGPVSLAMFADMVYSLDVVISKQIVIKPKK